MNKFLSGFLMTGLVVLSVFATACNGKSEKQKKADFIVKKVQEIEPAYVVSTTKFKTQRGGNWIVIQGVQGGVASYIAINLDIIDRGMSTADVNAAIMNGGVSGDVEIATKIGVTHNYLGGTSGQVYEETVATSKDLEKAGAAVEAYNLNHMAQALSANYGLSEERGLEVAKLATNWSKVSKTRSMTEADADAFATDLAGFDLSDAQAAYERAQAGDASAMNALIERAAGHNGVSPEQMSRIVSEVIAQ